MKAWKKYTVATLSVLIGLYAGAYFSGRPSYSYTPEAPRPAFKTFLATRLAASKRQGVRPNNEERFVSNTAGKAPLAILFIHGFGASRAEGEATIDALGKKFEANIYYLRLPGHGTNTADHASTRYPQYLSTAEEALLMMDQIGQKLIVSGSSTGALLATYLAAKYPQKVHGLILASPFYQFRDPIAPVLLALPGGINFIEAVYGTERDASWKSDPEKRRVEGYENYWLTKQRYRSLVPLNDLRRFIARESVFQRVTCPALVFYYYKDEQHQDGAVDVEAIKEAFAQFGQASKPSSLNKLVPVVDGNHILLSKYVRTDKALITRESETFIQKVLAGEQ